MNDPGLDAIAVTPSDATVLPKFRYLYVGSTGDVAVTKVNGKNVTITGVPTGQYVWLQGTKVLSTGTTASSITAFY